MKPQCTTAAQCLKELARVMEQFGIADPVEAVSSRYITISGLHWPEESLPTFSSPEIWRFAIAEVEGKPVFPGDTLYDMHGAITAGIWCKINPEGFSWNPPKPKTVMVEILREDAIVFATYEKPKFAPIDQRVAKACAKALKESE